MIVLKPVIVAEKISKTYIMGQVTVKALNEAGFQIYANELVCILGPSGSGKSTLLNIFGGMDKVVRMLIWLQILPPILFRLGKY